MNNFKRIGIAFILFLICVGVGVIWWIRGTQPANSSDTSQKIFVIKKATGMRELANSLKKDGLIKDPVVFFLLVKKLGLDNKIQAGDFRLSPSMSARQVAESLTVGTQDLWITIPEGKRADEVADILKENFSSYTEDWRTSLDSHEGYLFPDTYSFSRDTDIQTIENTLLNNFEKKYASIAPNPANTLTKQQVVIIASMVEREAKHDVDRPLVASVILNRLNSGMPLDLDATIQYALGYQTSEKTWWKKRLTDADLINPSLYNTRVHAGLPPGPISNPGLEALTAVIHPAKSDYLFYISDSAGNNHYAKTLSEHNANIKKYGL